MNERRVADRAATIAGRTRELTHLRDIVAHHAAGSGALVAIDGEAGIGKTTLLAELTSLTRQAGSMVFWVRCTEADQIRSFGALLDALDCRLQHPDPAFRRVAEILVGGIEAVVDPFRFDTDAAWRRPVQEAVVDLLLELVDRIPVLLAVDDIQWADAGTASVVAAIARRTQSTPLVIAWTQRATVRSQVADDVRGRFRDGLQQITLGPLNGDDVREVGAGLLGHPPDPAQTARLGRADGNPFFVTALIAHDADSKRADVVQQWLDRLPTNTSDLLAIASSIGVDFEVGLLGLVVQRTPDVLAELLQPAVRSGVLQTHGAGRYAFAHDLIRTAAEEAVPRSLRSAMHREIARVLETTGADVGVVARHLARGARPGDAATAERIRQACTSVMRSDAASAAELLEVAAGLCTPASPVWAEVMADWVIALQWSGRATESLTLANAAVDHPLHSSVGSRLRMVQATSLALVNDLPAAAATYRTIADDPSTPSAVRALVLAELATLEAWGVDRTKGRATANEALALAREVAAVQAELQTLCALSTMSLFDGEVHAAIAHGREAVQRGREHRSLAPAREVYLALALANADEHDEAAIWFRKGQSDAEAVSDLWLVSRYQLARMSSEVSTGEWESVVADAEAVIALHDDTGMGSGMPQAPAAAGLVAVRRGESDEVVSRYRELAGRHAKQGAELPGLLFTAWMEGLVAEREGRVADAAAILLFAYDTVIGNARLVQLWLAADVVRVVLAAGDRQRATEVAAQMTMFANEVVMARSALGVADLCAALVAKADGDQRSVALLERAAGHLRSAGRLPALLQALESLPQALTVTAERDQLIEQLGIRRVESPTTLPTPKSPLDRLTRTERSIASLIATGLANPAIATNLGLSKRTVEYHVSNIYMKLAVTSRLAVARLVDDHDRPGYLA